MYDRKLIKEIVAEILKEQGHDPVSKPTLHVITSEGIPEDLEEWKSSWHLNWIKPEDVEGLDFPSHALFPHVDQDLFVKSALGLADTAESRCFSRLVSSGTRVQFRLDRSLDWIFTPSEGIPAPYVERLRSYKEDLLSFRVSVLPSGDVLSPPGETSSSPFYYAGKLLTQKEVSEWLYNDIHISKETIVTPLAKDAAREANLIISIEES
ncbi:hypothetical protein [Halobacillus faecis]|uniref:Uncharacterized protein n=1 Tax=Halobacillus faecis TaxID=360184 RepID=A0A511WW59_9BACI|nr:hypothetical protein [Halobacillus faecis]GEN54561.1 hypothetical protein HFA01_28230 [Halobacillus faecis]